MSKQNVSIGRIVEFFPGKDTQYELPNGMQSAPAVVNQVFGEYINLTVFVAQPDESKPNTVTAWSIPHKSEAPENSFSWDWPARV